MTTNSGQTVRPLEPIHPSPKSHSVADEESGDGGTKMAKEDIAFKGDVYIRDDQDSHCSDSKKSSQGKSRKGCVAHVTETPHDVVGCCEDSNCSSSKLSLERPSCVSIGCAQDTLSAWGSKSSSEMSRYYSPKTCSICMERYSIGDDIAWSPNENCPHAFHVECIVRWLMTHSRCPMCRSSYLDEHDSNCATTR